MRLFRRIGAYYPGQETWREYWNGLVYPIWSRLQIAFFRRKLARMK